MHKKMKKEEQEKAAKLQMVDPFFSVRIITIGVGIITIFLHYILYMYFRNNVDYMYKYSLTWKFPEQVNIMSGVYVLVGRQ